MATVTNLCRLCTKSTNSSVYLNHADTDKIKYIDKLKFVSNNVILEEDSKISFKICQVCCKKLRQSYDFKKQCATSYEYWQLHFHKIGNIKNEPYDGDFNKIKQEDTPMDTPTPVRKRGRPRKVKSENELTAQPKLIDTENKLMTTNMKNKLGSVLKSNNTESTKKLGSILKPNNVEPTSNPNIFSLKNKLNTLLKSDTEIKKEFSINTFEPIQLNFTSLKSKLVDALKIGIQNVEKEKDTNLNRPPIKQKYLFLNKSCYIIDMKGKRFYCKLCNKCFLNINSFKFHVSQDLGIKNVPCNFCKRRFYSRKELKSHLKSLHLHK